MKTFVICLFSTLASNAAFALSLNCTEAVQQDPEIIVMDCGGLIGQNLPL